MHLWKNHDIICAVADLIFTKSVFEPKCCAIYSDLCLSLHLAEKNIEKEKFERRFYGAIIRKCQTSFEATSNSAFQDSITKLEELIKKEIQDEKMIADFNEQIEELKEKEKQRLMGTNR